MTQNTSFIVYLALAVSAFIPQRSEAAKPSKDLLPATTKFSLSIANGQQFNDRFAETDLGKLISDPTLKPFLDDLPRQLRSEASDHPLGVLWIDLGIEASDLRGVSDGEVAWALVRPDEGRPSRVFIADVADRQQQVEKLMPKVAASMKQQNARKSDTKVGTTTLTVYDIPAEDNLAARKLVIFQQDQQLVFTEDVAVAKTLLNNLTEQPTEVLASQPGYQQVVKQCEDRADGQIPDAVLFLVPTDLSESLRLLSPIDDDRADEGLSIARKHNFDAISAAGGFLAMGRDAFDLHLQLAVYAPQPWKSAMRICSFPNARLTPSTWAAADLGGFSMINVEFSNLAKYFGPLFDDVYGEGEEGLYDDLKNTLLEDPDGPQVDIDKELFGRLSPQTTLLARDVLPVTPDSAQRLIAFSIDDEAGLKAVVKKVLESDPNSEAEKIAGFDAFFSYVEEELDDFGKASGDDDPDQAPSFVTCVANGHLIFATDAKLLEDVLNQGKSLEDDANYQSLAPHLRRLGEETCIQYVGKLRDALRVNYELLRQGKKPNTAKSFRGLLNNIAAGEPPEIKEPKFDGSKLPDFEAVQKYLGPAGLVGITTDSGWYLEGFVLKQP